MMQNSKRPKAKSVIIKQRNTIIALLIIFTVLVIGFVIVNSALSEEETPTTTTEAVELLPGEVAYGNSTLIFDRVPREKMKKVSVHNPSNAALGKQYVDWDITFAYDSSAEDYYGFFSNQLYADIDSTQLSYFVSAAGLSVFSARVEDHCTDFSLYGLSFENEEDATYYTLETTDGKVYKLYFGNKNPSGTGYYVRSADEVTDEEGNTYVRDSVYLMSSMTTSYVESTILASPASMLNTLLSYPIASKFSTFALYSSDETVDVAFISLDETDAADKILASSSIYKAINPEGYFSSSQFETRISRFESLAGSLVIEYATETKVGKDDDGEEYTYYYFPEEVLAKYGLDADNAKYFLFYSAYNEDVAAYIDSEIYFSSLQPDGYYYAYSLCFNTIVRVEASTVDFLEWTTLDFIDSYPLRMPIGYCEKLEIAGTLNGKPYSETFTAKTDNEYMLTEVYAATSGEKISVDRYRTLFQVIYNTMMRDKVPESLDTEKLMNDAPYLTISVTTPKVDIYMQDSDGNNTGKLEASYDPMKRIVRFYKYSENRAFITIETIDQDGKSSGESGSFYVSLPRLDKIISDADKICRGEDISMFERD